MAHESRITVIGSGKVAKATAENLRGIPKHLVLKSRDPKIEGFAMDLRDAMSTERAPKRNHTIIKGATEYAATEGSDIVIVAAGLPRKPGQKRNDPELIKANKAMLTEILEGVLKYNPDPILLIATNPLDVMTYYASFLTGFKKNKVIGLSGALDGSRFAGLISKKLGVPPHKITPLVLGEHGPSMVPITELTFVNMCENGGDPELKSLDELVKMGRLSHSDLMNLVENTVNRGTHIVETLKDSASVAPGMALARMAEEILFDIKEQIGASVLLTGEYGESRVCMGVPVMLYNKGVYGVINVHDTMSEPSKVALAKSADAIRTDIAKLDLPMQEGLQ